MYVIQQTRDETVGGGEREGAIEGFKWHVTERIEGCMDSNTRQGFIKDFLLAGDDVISASLKH